MEIKGKYNTYMVKWGRYGGTYAAVYIYRQQKFLGLFKYMKKVWVNPDSVTGYPKYYFTAKNMHKTDMIKWFEDQVNKYEQYCESWRIEP